MKSDFFRAICQMGIFMLCAQSIIHFRPKASYEKYLKMLVSVMLLIQLFLPVGKLVFGSSADEFAERVKLFEQSLEVSMKQAEENAAGSQSRLEEMSLEEVRNRMESQEAEKAQAEEKERDQDAQNVVIEPIEPVEQIRIETDTEERGEENAG